MMRKVKRWVRLLQRNVRRWWYAPMLGLLAAADLFVVVVPTDSLLVSAAMLVPRRWFYFACITSLGSALGSVALAALLKVHGLPLLLEIVPGIDQSQAWQWTVDMMSNWGSWALFLVALSPLMQHPAVALAAFSAMPLTQVFFYVFAGRVLKYLFLAWVSTHAPGMLKRLWGIQKELEQVRRETEK